MLKHILALLILLAADLALACDCMSPDVQRSFRDAHLVFEAFVESAEIRPHRRYVLDARVRTLTRFKGEPTEIEQLTTGTSTSSCGYGSLTVGARYIFFVNKDNSFDLCSGTIAVMPDPQAYVETLNELKELNDPDA